MVNMGELFAHPRIHGIKMDLVPVEKKEHHYLLAEGDLLFARQSLVLSGAGQCSIFMGNAMPTVFESHLIRCRLETKRSNPLFYFYFSGHLRDAGPLRRLLSKAQVHRVYGAVT